VSADQGVGRQRHVRAVLLSGAERDDDGVATRVALGLDLRPGHAIQLDGAHATPPRLDSADDNISGGDEGAGGQWP
jgi:hypothetical protein